MIASHSGRGADVRHTPDTDPLVIVSQRGPLSFAVDADGGLNSHPGSGGLVTALTGVDQQHPVRWVALALSAVDRAVADEHCIWQDGTTELRLITLPPDVETLHRQAFANPLLWFLQHGLMDGLHSPCTDTAMERAWSDGYCPANRILARHAATAAQGERPIILVQDYQLYLVPRLLRLWRPAARVAHFVHIPWPAPVAWERLPRAIVRGLVHGLLGADLIGVQRDSDADHLLATCSAVLPEAEVCTRDGVVLYHGRPTFVRPYPVTIDAAAVAAVAADLRTRQQADAFDQARSPATQTIVRVDRLDPSKNIVRGFLAYRQLLVQHPHWRERVQFHAHLVPTRGDIPEYRDAAAEVFALAAAINQQFGTPHWQPITIVYTEDRGRAIAALMRADVVLVNPLADGMNLVAKEAALVNERSGVLVLSRAAGAWDELGDGALGVTPTDVDGTAAALMLALTMPAAERRRRAAVLRCRVQERSPQQWLVEQLHDLGEAIPPMRGRTWGTASDRRRALR